MKKKTTGLKLLLRNIIDKQFFLNIHCLLYNQKNVLYHIQYFNINILYTKFPLIILT